MFLAVVVCVIFVAAPALGQVTATTLPAYHASGATPYELGVAVGGLAKESYQALILADDSINTVLRPWAAAHPADFAAFRRNNAQFYADIAEELRGMAAGAGVSEEDVWLLMLRPEIEALASHHRRPNASSSSSSDEEENSASDGPLPKLFSGEACMDVLLRPKSSALDVLLGHNEDWNAVYKRFGFLLYERQPFAEANGSATEIAAFTYPLTSSGFTFGWNSAGVVTSCNALGPLNINIGGLGRYFVNRDVLASLSIDDAIARLRRAAPHVAFGFALSVGCVGSRRLVHTETAPSGVVDVLELQPGTALVHANKYTHDAFNNIEQWYSTSTDHRLRRAAQLSPPAENATSVLGILGDTNDIDGSGNYPIYRSGAPPDDSGTVATALFDLGTGTVAIYGDNPKQTAPLAVLPLFAPPGWGTSQTASLELRLFWPLVGIAAGALLIAVVSLSILASLCRNPLPRRRYTPINSSS